MSGHISWRDDIRRMCQCGHHKGSHALADGPCLTFSGCQCLAFEPPDVDEDEGKGRDG